MTGKIWSGWQTIVGTVLVQAVAQSMVEPGALPEVHAKKGVSASSLQPTASWFSGAFQQLSPEDAARKVMRA